MIPTKPSPTTTRRFLVAAFSLILAAHLHGQAVSATPNASAADLAKYDKNKNGKLDADELAQMQKDTAKGDDAVQLTPFEVSTSKDRGYAAGNTLSGGRVDTPLAITPGSISVMTKEFMDDFNIVNMNDAGSWMIGVDLGTAVPNSNPAGESVYQNIIRGAPVDNNFPTRDGTVNFGAADSYNTERFEFQRGPDTAMFGDGGPGGRQGSQSKRASFNRTSTTLSMQGDSWNGFRHTLDYSKGWERLGVRFDALYQDAPGFAAGRDKTKKAWTLTTNGKLTKNTTVSASYERMNEWNSLWSITNGDAQAAWDSTTVNNDNSALLANNNTSLNAVGLERMTVAANGTATNMFVYNYGTHDMQDYGGNQYRTRGIGTLGPNLRIPYRGNPFLLAIPSRRAPIPNMDRRFSAAPKDNIAARDSDTASISLEHRIGNLFVRVGFTKNDFDNNTIWSNTSPNAYIIDVNKVLPNGALNPKFLHPFTDVEQNNIYSEDRIRSYQGLATYRFAVPRWWDYTQQLSVSTEKRETTSEGATRAWRRVDNPIQSDPYNNANRFFYRVYWDDPKADLAPILTDPNKIGFGKWAYVEGGGGGNGKDSITIRKLTHASLTSQSAFFNQKLAITGSYSQDKVGVDFQGRVSSPTLLAGSTGAAGGYKNVLGVNNIPGTHFLRNKNVHSAAIGTVFYPFQFKNEGVLRTFLSPLGFVFNFAENTEPPTSSNPAPLIDGTEPPLTHSRTKDFGLRYSVPGGRAYLTLSHYNTTQVDKAAAFGSGADITTIWTNLGYTDPKLTTTTAGSGFNYSDPNSRKLEGWEAELTANPTRNITLLVNYSHPLVYTIGDSDDRKKYVAAHRDEWAAGAKAAQGATVNGHVILDPVAIQNALTNIDNSIAGIASGVLEDGANVHRINATAAYSFTEGMLKGLRVNAGVQYRSHMKSGSRDARIKFGLPDSATPTTLQNTQAAWDYLWTPSYWKHTLTVGANYTHRFGKQTWRFQLNVTNLLDEQDPIWGRSGLGFGAYTTVGENILNAGNKRTQFLYSFANPEPRKFALTSTVTF